MRLLFAVLCLFAATAQATPVLQTESATVTFSGELGLAALYAKNNNFGAGHPVTNNKNSWWGEGFVKPMLKGEYNATGQWYGGVSGVASFTNGDGDPAGFTADQPNDIDVDHLYAGWRSGTVFATENLLDISIGRQSYDLGDSFIFGDGHFDQGEEGTLWLSPRDAYAFTTIARLNTDPVMLEAVYLRGDADQGKTDVMGVNGEIDVAAMRLGLSYFNVLDSRFAGRDGLDIYNVHLTGHPLADMPEWYAGGEYVQQENSTQNTSAHAWYLENSYIFSETMFTPTVRYRYSFFDAKYDSMFYGYANRGWGTWFQGEFIGEYVVPNMNAAVQMFDVVFKPVESVTAGVQYFQYDRDRPVAGSARAFADEINLFADWFATDNVIFSLIYALAKPDDAAQAEFADDTTHLWVLTTYITF